MDHRLSTEVPLDLSQDAEKGLDHDGPHRPTTIAESHVRFIIVNNLDLPAELIDEPQAQHFPLEICCLSAHAIVFFHTDTVEEWAEPPNHKERRVARRYAYVWQPATSPSTT
jgi:hypothetical protein